MSKNVFGPHITGEETGVRKYAFWQSLSLLLMAWHSCAAACYRQDYKLVTIRIENVNYDRPEVQIISRFAHLWVTQFWDKGEMTCPMKCEASNSRWRQRMNWNLSMFHICLLEDHGTEFRLPCTVYAALWWILLSTHACTLQDVTFLVFVQL